MIPCIRNSPRPHSTLTMHYIYICISLTKLPYKYQTSGFASKPQFIGISPYKKNVATKSLRVSRTGVRSFPNVGRSGQVWQCEAQSESPVRNPPTLPEPYLRAPANFFSLAVTAIARTAIARKAIGLRTAMAPRPHTPNSGAAMSCPMRTIQAEGTAVKTKMVRQTKVYIRPRTNSLPAESPEN